MIDLHTHLLPDIDDGPQSESEALDLAQALVESGVDRVVATPHVSLRYPNRSALIEERRRVAERMLERASIDLRIETGAEISAGVAGDLSDEELARLALGSTDWLLVEPPTTAPPFALHSSIFGLAGRGFKVLLAHPERNPAIQQDLELLASLVDGGVRTQVTAGSFTGRYGRTAEKVSRKMMERGLIHTVSSDAHHATLRPPELAEPLTRAGFGEMVQYLCQEMPAWILDGGDPPPRPEFMSGSNSGRGILTRLGLRR